MSEVRLVVDLDVAVDAGHCRARHMWRGAEVHAATYGPAGLRAVTVDVADWQRELAHAVPSVPPDVPDTPPAAGLEVPWDLVVASGGPLTGHRPDLYDVLVARAAGAVRVAGRPLHLGEVHAQLRRLHGSVAGRLRCSAVVPSSRRVGCVSWLLYADGWRALTPYPDPCDHRPMVRLEPRAPGDLAHEVAAWAVAR